VLREGGIGRRCELGIEGCGVVQAQVRAPPPAGTRGERARRFLQPDPAPHGRDADLEPLGDRNLRVAGGDGRENALTEIERVCFHTPMLPARSTP